MANRLQIGRTTSNPLSARLHLSPDFRLLPNRTILFSVKLLYLYAAPFHVWLPGESPIEFSDTVGSAFDGERESVCVCVCVSCRVKIQSSSLFVIHLLSTDCPSFYHTCYNCVRFPLLVSEVSLILQPQKVALIFDQFYFQMTLNI